MYVGKIIEKGIRKDIFIDLRYLYIWVLILVIFEDRDEKFYII